MIPHHVGTGGAGAGRVSRIRATFLRRLRLSDEAIHLPTVDVARFVRVVVRSTTVHVRVIDVRRDALLGLRVVHADRWLAVLHRDAVRARERAEIRVERAVLLHDHNDMLDLVNAGRHEIRARCTAGHPLDSQLRTPRRRRARHSRLAAATAAARRDAERRTPQSRSAGSSVVAMSLTSPPRLAQPQYAKRSRRLSTRVDNLKAQKKGNQRCGRPSRRHAPPRPELPAETGRSRSVPDFAGLGSATNVSSTKRWPRPDSTTEHFPTGASCACAPVPTKSRSHRSAETWASPVKERARSSR